MKGSQVEIIGIETVRGLDPSAFDLRKAQARLDSTNDTLGDLVLKLEDIL